MYNNVPVHMEKAKQYSDSCWVHNGGNIVFYAGLYHNHEDGIFLDQAGLVWLHNFQRKM